MTFNPKVSLPKIVEFANIVDPVEVAHNEPPHQDLHCLLSSFDGFGKEFSKLRIYILGSEIYMFAI